MNLFVHSVRWPQRQAFDPEVKQFFGLRPEDKWPEQGMSSRTIQGILCWVDPLTVGRFTIRARAMCPVCSRTVPIGRLEQHSKIHRETR